MPDTTSLRRLQLDLLDHLRTEAHLELRAVDPHTVQDARQLASDGHDRAKHARPLCDPEPPGPQGRVALHPQQQACSGLAESFADSTITLLGYVPFEVDGCTGLMSPGASNRSAPQPFVIW